MRKRFGGALEDVEAQPHEEDHHERPHHGTDRALAAGDHGADDGGYRADGSRGHGSLKQDPDVIGRHGGNSAFHRGQGVVMDERSPGPNGVLTLKRPSHYGP
ncbi:hypothetical protein GCM10010385_47730 [Streptomyces geysiriensis]|nr:hypothetical protein GCM10010385_47730 [Streptomyces geysiriensis]GGZ33282.1 hypothetical protein GCM10010301_00690 [Streptomyces plicatus]GHC30074.1 hypothetical protein GCM10010308_54580 [Streptomyces vinaceusdrappus]